MSFGPVVRANCRFCGVEFHADRLAAPLVRAWCPRCQAVYVAANRAVLLAEATRQQALRDADVVIPRDMPHVYLIQRNLTGTRAKDAA